MWEEWKEEVKNDTLLTPKPREKSNSNMPRNDFSDIL